MTQRSLSGPVCTVILSVCAGALIAHYGIPRSAPPSPVSSAEVSDLIARLKPLARNPDAAWYSNGIEIAFSGSDVRIILKLRDGGSEYHAYADTLQDAVTRLTEPSDAVRSALAGWKAE